MTTIAPYGWQDRPSTVTAGTVTAATASDDYVIGGALAKGSGGKVKASPVRGA